MSFIIPSLVNYVGDKITTSDNNSSTEPSPFTHHTNGSVSLTVPSLTWERKFILITAELERLNIQCERLISENESLKNHINNIYKENERLNALCIEKAEENDSLREKYESITGEIEFLRVEKMNLSRDVASFLSISNEKAREIEALREAKFIHITAELERLISENKSLKHHINNIYKENDMLDALCIEKAEENDSLRVKYESITGEIEFLRVENMNLSRDVASLLSISNEKDREIEALREKFAEEVDSLLAKNMNLDREVVNLRSRSKFKSPLLKQINSSKKITIVIVGRTGAGKSTLANEITKTTLFKEGDSLFAQTSEPQAENIIWPLQDDLEVMIVDTPGFGDNRLGYENNKLISNIFTFLPQLKGGINVCLFCTHAKARFDDYDRKELNIIGELLGKGIFNHVWITVTQVNNLKEDAKNKCYEIYPKFLPELLKSMAWG